ncbi:serine/threonine-protein phosphatase [Streptomyces pactum]|uniref:Serine/threonine-protein phosphatase n=1 Tax=Streptomyces pactum TaxID=68249 RepID=A0ABS0NM39_9ACTN|nr:serine/threonine-protein phosphatase [Streptomyces pactum]
MTGRGAGAPAGGGGANGREADRERRRNRRFAGWLSAALIAGGVVFDLLTPRNVSAAPFFAAAPLIAAPFATFAVTAFTAAASVGTALVLMLCHGFDGPHDRTESLFEFVTVLTVALLALATNRVVRRGGRKLASARGIAAAVQRAVLPVPPAVVGGLGVAARYEAAQADAGIGGDLYAVQETPHGVRAVVGDVRGKGLGAVEAVTVVLGAFREAAEEEPDLEGLAGRLERALDREGRRRANLDQVEGFTTAVLAEIPPGASTVRLLNRGHPPPLLFLPGGGVRTTEPAVPAMPLGMRELGEWPDRADELAFPPGATLLLFTDGVTEARDAHGVFYDPAGRLGDRTWPDPDTLLDALVTDVVRHTGGAAADDMALLAVHRPGESGEPAAEPGPVERNRTGPGNGPGNGPAPSRDGSGPA